MISPGLAYDDLDIHDPYYLNDQFSSGHLPLVPHSSMVMTPRHRHHSSVSYTTRPAPMLDTYHLPGSLKIKFRRKGSFSAGITLREAQDHYIRLSGNDSYSLYDFHGDSHSRILLRIQAFFSILESEHPANIEWFSNSGLGTRQ